MGAILPFFLILLAALFFSELSSRFRIPWVVSLIAAGMVIGPHGFGVVEIDTTLQFVADIGLIFLMFMAGITTKLSTFRENRKEIGFLAFGGGAIPFILGMAIGLILGFPQEVVFTLGIIFISSSIAVVIPTLEDNGLLNLKIGKTIVAATIIDDIASLALLSILIQTISRTASLPLPVFYGVFLGMLFALRWALPWVRKSLKKVTGKKDVFEHELHIIFTILIGVVVLFELLGLHPITAGFFAGLVLSEELKSKKLIEKLRAISYGIFIPIFFVTVGAKVDLGVLREVNTAVPLVLLIVSASMASKFVGGTLGGMLGGFSLKESMLAGASGLPQLSTTLAVVFAGFELGILSQQIIVAMVFLSVTTALVSPILIKYIAMHMRDSS